MTKPWEEEWEQSDDRWIERSCPVDGKPLTVARFDSANGGARARLASKAPKMANLLARILDEHGAHMPYTANDIEAVLREAGVLE